MRLPHPPHPHCDLKFWSRILSIFTALEHNLSQHTLDFGSITLEQKVVFNNTRSGGSIPLCLNFVCSCRNAVPPDKGDGGESVSSSWCTGGGFRSEPTAAGAAAAAMREQRTGAAGPVLSLCTEPAAVPCRAGLLPAPPARALPRPFPDPAARRRAPARAGSGSGRREGLLVLPLTWGRGRGQQGGQRRGQETHGPWGAGSRPFPLRRAGCLLSSPADPPFSPSLSSPPLSPPFFPLSPYPPYLFALPTVRPPPELPSSFPLLLPFSFLRPEPAGMA